MNVNLTRQEAIRELRSLFQKWKSLPSGQRFFYVETQYVDFFIYMLKEIQVNETQNILPLIHEFLKQGFDIAAANILRVLDQNTVDRTHIDSIITNKQLMLKRDRRVYNSQLPGKSKNPNGIQALEWEAYNNWLLAMFYWQGYIASHEYYSIRVWQDRRMRDAAIKTLLFPEFKILWDMRESAAVAGIPILGEDDDCVLVHPYLIFYPKIGNSGNVPMSSFF
jgi:hypothetical protein